MVNVRGIISYDFHIWSISAVFRLVNVNGCNSAIDEISLIYDVLIKHIGDYCAKNLWQMRARNISNLIYVMVDELGDPGKLWRGYR